MRLVGEHEVGWLLDVEKPLPHFRPDMGCESASTGIPSFSRGIWPHSSMQTQWTGNPSNDHCRSLMPEVSEAPTIWGWDSLQQDSRCACEKLPKPPKTGLPPNRPIQGGGGFALGIFWQGKNGRGKISPPFGTIQPRWQVSSNLALRGCTKNPESQHQTSKANRIGQGKNSPPF